LSYAAWPELLEGKADVWAVQYPGRENRLSEPPIRSVELLSGQLAEAIRAENDKPVVFFGHSLGSLVAFETARALRGLQTAGPIHLFVSGREGPNTNDPEPPMHRLPDGELISELNRRYGNGIPAAVLAEPSLLRVFLPVLRADLEMNETYRYVTGEPLTCPISAFGGRRDRKVGEVGLGGWRQETRGFFSMRMFEGDHFFVSQKRPQVIAAILEALQATDPTSRC
jgi:medium-chain acyl-[acyl-carrier-protein] hydrolase